MQPSPRTALLSTAPFASPRRGARRLVAVLAAAVVALSGIAAAPAAQAAPSSPESMSQRVAKKATRTWKAVPAKRVLGGAKGTPLRAGKAVTKKLKRPARVPAGTTSLVVRVTVKGAAKAGTLQLWTPGRAKVERTTVAYRAGRSSDTVRVTTTARGKIRLKATGKVRVTIHTRGYTRHVGKPSAATTGVPAGTTLRVHQGDLTVTKPGTVIDGLDVRGAIRVRANDVTIRNTVVRGRPVSSILHLVQIADDARRTTIVDSEIYGAQPSPYVMGVLGGSFTLLRVDIHDVIDQVSVIGSDVLVEDSWLHDNLYYAKDPNHGGTPSHDDNIQIYAGSNLRFTGNRLEDSSSAAVMITQGRSPVSNIRFEDNWINHGACSVNITPSRFGPLSAAAVTGNRFGTDTRLNHCGVILPSSTSITDARNSFADNQAFRTSRGA